MEKETKKLLIERLKGRLQGVTEKFNVLAYKGEFSNEYTSLIIFSEFINVAINGFDFILRNVSTNNQGDFKLPLNIITQLYSSSILYYSKMYRGGKGVNRENIDLLESTLFNLDGTPKLDKQQKIKKATNDRFYIEEFYTKDSMEFKLHYNILNQVDKFFTHIDKTDLAKCMCLILLDKTDTQKYLGLDNYFEYFNLPSIHDLQEMNKLFSQTNIKVNNKIREIAHKIHDLHDTMEIMDLGEYYKEELLINEIEL